MEPFTINLAGDVLRVHPNENGSYSILKDDIRVGDIWPTETEAGNTWSSEELSMDTAMQVGELIDEREMG